MSDAKSEPAPKEIVGPPQFDCAAPRIAGVSLVTPKGRQADGTVPQCPDEVERAAQESLWDDNPPRGDDFPPLVPTGYEITSKLGEGTYGEVWKGVHTRTGVQVAVKFLRARMLSQLESLGQEAKKLAMLHSDPRIVRLIDVEERATVPYFIIDFAEHGSLAGRLKKGPLPVSRALAIFRDIVEAIAYVHAKGIRHCDLKPGNILLDAADRPRVADFGQSHLSVEATQAALGTFFYMAPEQASAEQHVPDARWDVFGLGALLYAMVTGTPPRFDASLKQELEQTAHLSHRLERYRKWVAQSPPPTGHRGVRGMDRALAEIIDRCLAADPAQRYRDAGEVLRALKRRERRGRARPIMVFGIGAPLLLATALILCGKMALYNARNTAKEALAGWKDYKKQQDGMTAQMVADAVEENLTRLAHAVDRYSESKELRQPLIDLAAVAEEEKRHGHAAQAAAQVPLVLPHPEENVKQREARQALEAHLQKLGARESNVVMFCVVDRNGILRAAWQRSNHPEREHPSEVYGQDFSFRAYFNRTGDDHTWPRRPHEFRRHTKTGLQDGKQLEVPYIGQPYLTLVDESYACISVSMPIFDDDSPGAGAGKNPAMVGLLVASVHLEQFNHWLRRAENEGTCVVLIDKHGYCVHHREEYRKEYEPRMGANPAKKKCGVYDAVLAGKSGNDDAHVDPYGAEEKASNAAYASVSPFGWGVIVPYDSHPVADKLNELEQSLQGLFWMAMALNVPLLMVFWGWLIWTLVGKEKEVVADA